MGVTEPPSPIAAGASQGAPHEDESRRRAIRTTNLLERLFIEERRRLKIIPNAFGERQAVFGAKFARRMSNSA